MTHRHLLPNEFDLLLDQETGFGVQPLREHVRGCAECRAQLEGMQRVASRLSELAPIAPRFGLVERVMAHVPIFVPWHVAARDALAAWVPARGFARVATVALVGGVGAVLTTLVAWVATRADVVALVTGLAGEGARTAASNTAGEALVALFGGQVVAVLQRWGSAGLALTGAGFVAAALVTIVGLRHVATSSRARS